MAGFTDAATTPSTPVRLRSTRAAHEAHVMPATGSSSRAVAATASYWVGVLRATRAERLHTPPLYVNLGP